MRYRNAIIVLAGIQCFAGGTGLKFSSLYDIENMEFFKAGGYKQTSAILDTNIPGSTTLRSCHYIADNAKPEKNFNLLVTCFQSKTTERFIPYSVELFNSRFESDGKASGQSDRVGIVNLFFKSCKIPAEPAEKIVQEILEAEKTGEFFMKGYKGAEFNGNTVDVMVMKSMTTIKVNFY
jgi:hypothetical protein